MAGIQQVSFTAPGSDYTGDIAEIERRRKLAEALQAQSMEPLQTNRMAGGWVIPVSPLEGLAKVAQGAVSGYQEQKAMDQQKALTKRYNDDLAAALMKYQDAQGSPSIQSPSDELGGGPARPAIAPDRNAMIQALMSHPATQAMALSQLAPKAPIKLGAGESLYDANTFKPVATAPKEPKYHVVNGSLVQEPQPGATSPVAPVYTAPEKEPEVIRILKAAGLQEGSPQWAQAMQNLVTKTTTHQPPTQVTTNVSTEKEYGEQFAGKIAAADSDMRDAAIKAPQLADRANQVLKLLSDGKVITGTGADFRLAFAKAAKLAGIEGANGTAADTEQVSTMLAQNTLDAIKASGLGSGSGFSNADRDFLEKAVGGKISLEKETLQRLASLSHKAAVATADKWNTRVKAIPQSVLEGTGITRDPTIISPIFGGKVPAVADDPLGLRK